jgi:Ca2+-binding EF-hand superfamily protein
MPRTTQALIAAGFLSALSIGPLGAQPAPPPAGSEVTPATRHLSTKLIPGQNLERHLEAWRHEFYQADADMNGEINEADIAMHVEAGGAVHRMSAIAQVLSADFDGDGAVTEEELRRLIRYNMRLSLQPGQQPNDQAFEALIRKLKAMDADGDGRVTIAEVLKSAKSSVEDAGQVTHFAHRARSFLTLARDGKKSVKLTDIEPAVEALFRTVDADGDNKLSREEIRAYRLQPNQPEGQARLAAEQAARQREETRRAAEAKRLREEAEANAACAMPKASETAKVVLVGGYRTEALSTTTIGSQDVAVGVGNVTVEAGNEPIYLVMVSFRPTIWRFYGAVERIERLVLTSTMTGPGRGTPQEKPLVGATGIPAERVTFLGQSKCLGYFSETPSSQSAIAAAAVRRATGKDALVIAARYGFSDVAVPSGKFQSVPDENRGKLVIVKPSGTLRIEGDASNVIVQSGPNSLIGDLQRFSPGGVIEVDPKRVVSSLVAERYQVLPQQAGLLQLVQSGALVQNRAGEFMIKQKMRFPAELHGAHSVKFLLLRGTPMPDGDPGHSEVFSEETGEKLKFGGRG